MEDNNDKSSVRLQRRNCRRRIHYISVTTLLIISYYTIIYINNPNNRRKLLSRNNNLDGEWKIKRAIDIMKHREKKGGNNKNKNHIRKMYHDMNKRQQQQQQRHEEDQFLSDQHNMNRRPYGRMNREEEEEERFGRYDYRRKHGMMSPDEEEEIFGRFNNHYDRIDHGISGDIREGRYPGGRDPREEKERYMMENYHNRHRNNFDPRRDEYHNHRMNGRFDPREDRFYGGGHGGHGFGGHGRGHHFRGEGGGNGGHRVIVHENGPKTATPTPNPVQLNATHPYRWINPRVLPKVVKDGEEDDGVNEILRKAVEKIRSEGHNRADFNVQYQQEKPEHKLWEREIDEYDRRNNHNNIKPKVDYRDLDFVYPEVIMSPPKEGGYPQLKPLSQVLEEWPQDDIDLEHYGRHNKMKEVLLHFDYSNITERNAAIQFRDRELPFKVYNVPEIDAATEKWTDEYVSQEFEFSHRGITARGHCQRSDNNYFAFFRNNNWEVSTMGPPPTMDMEDMSFALWAKHARYADLKSIPPYHRHYYWQAGAPHTDVFQSGNPSQQCFISSDLPSFSSQQPNFFSFHTDDQKGIQCRFGERGVTAATHYDAGRNMVAMITGAKRYILSPPSSCSKLGIINEKHHPAFRHSLLNFAHVNIINDKETTKDMSDEERAWLNVAANAPSLSTVLNEGEVLYIPSHWFHYITSLQKSAQCNVRSGRDVDGSEEFGGMADVEVCGDESRRFEYENMRDRFLDGHYGH